MKITNLTRNVLLFSEAKKATSFIDRALGLINPNNPKAMIFDTRFGIHTFFMKHPIDVAILNHQNLIVKICHSLPPYNLFFYNPKYSIVIELPAGTLKKSQTRLNDKIKIG